MASSLLVACVPKGTYDAAIADERARNTALAASFDRETVDRDKACDNEIAKLATDIDAAWVLIRERDLKLHDATTANHNLQAQLDEATAINERLRSELVRLGKNVDQMVVK